MKKRKKAELKPQAKAYWRSFYWTTNIMKRYFKGELPAHEEKQVAEKLDAIVDNVFAAGKPNLWIVDTHLDKADRIIRKNVFEHLGLPVILKKKAGSIYLRLSKYAAVAAVFLLLIGFSYWGLQPKPNIHKQTLSQYSKPTLLLQTASNKIDSILLPDGTLAYLNGNSRLSYKAGAFNKDKREVWLSGEAYFNVAKNPSKPFIIHSNGMETKVLGTSFNVKAYAALSEQVVSVSTGNVMVYDGKGQSVHITPNQKAVFDKQANTLTTGATNSSLASSWRNGNIVFDHSDNQEIALRIRQRFGKEVILRGNALKGAHFIASYPQQTTLEEIVKTIALTNNVTYTITYNQVIFK